MKSNALIGEGPVWEETEQTLLFVDIGGQKILRWNSLTNHLQSVDTGQPFRRQLVLLPPVRSLRLLFACVLPGDMVGFAVPRRSGSYVAGVGRSVVAVDWPTGAMTSLVQVDHDKPNNRLNDGKVDPAGRLLGGG